MTSHDDSTIVIDDEPAPKKPLAKRSSNVIDDEPDHVGAGTSPKAAAKKPRAKKVQATSIDELGWTIVPPSLIHRYSA